MNDLKQGTLNYRFLFLGQRWRFLKPALEKERIESPRGQESSNALAIRRLENARTKTLDELLLDADEQSVHDMLHEAEREADQETTTSGQLTRAGDEGDDDDENDGDNNADNFSNDNGGLLSAFGALPFAAPRSRGSSMLMMDGEAFPLHAGRRHSTGMDLSRSRPGSIGTPQTMSMGTEGEGADMFGGRKTSVMDGSPTGQPGSPVGTTSLIPGLEFPSSAERRMTSMGSEARPGSMGAFGRKSISGAGSVEGMPGSPFGAGAAAAGSNFMAFRKASNAAVADSVSSKGSPTPGDLYTEDDYGELEVHDINNTDPDDDDDDNNGGDQHPELPRVEGKPKRLHWRRYISCYSESKTFVFSTIILT
jgi:hypothetical protein